MKKTLLLAMFAIAALTFTSCDDDEDPIIPNEEELITTVQLTLSPTDGGAAKFFQFQDLDGDGGDAPNIVTATLDANTTYNASLEFLNELESPAEDITEEIEEEDEEHQIFFSLTNNIITVAYADADGNGNPLGLETTMTTGDAGSTMLTIVLRHEPNKSAAGVSDGNIANAGGETDIEVTFEVDVQ